LLPALKWLRLLTNHIPDKYERLVRYYGYYSNRSRRARRLAEQACDTSATVVVDERPVDTRRKANWARLVDLHRNLNQIGPFFAAKFDPRSGA